MKKLILFAISFIITLFVGEAFLYLAKIEIPIDEVDPIIGRKKKNGVEFTRLDDGFFLGRINDQGYLGPSRPYTKDMNEYRIVLLGDSYVQAQFVFDKYSHRAILEKEIDKRLTDKKVYVLNFGMAQFGLQNIYAYYSTFAKNYNPDIVLVFLADNTFNFNFKTLVPSVKFENNTLLVKSDFQHGTLYKLYTKFPILMSSATIRMVYKVVRYKNFPTEVIFGKFANLFSGKTKEQLLLEEREDEYISGKSDYTISDIDKKILKYFNEMGNVFFVLRTSPSNELTNLINSLNLNVIDLVPTLTQLKNEGIDPFYWKVTHTRGHWNHAGNKAVANTIAEDIYTKLLTINN